MNKTFTFLLLSFFTIFFSCKKKELNVYSDKKLNIYSKNELNVISTKIPIDFNFEIKYPNNSYNSESKIFNRQFQKGQKIIKISLNKTELNQLYKVIKENDFINLPETQTCGSEAQPSFFYKIIFTINQKIFIKELTLYPGSKDCEKQSVLKFIDKFNSIIIKKPELSNLPESDIYFE